MPFIAKCKVDRLEKAAEFAEVYKQWLYLCQHNIGLQFYFSNKGYSQIAIYGMNEIAERLLDELADTNICVECIIDKNADGIYIDDTRIVCPDSIPSSINAIVVASIHYYEDIKNELSKRCECPIVSLKDVVNELYAGDV